MKEPDYYTPVTLKKDKNTTENDDTIFLNKLYKKEYIKFKRLGILTVEAALIELSGNSPLGYQPIKEGMKLSIKGYSSINFRYSRNPKLNKDRPISIVYCD